MNVSPQTQQSLLSKIGLRMVTVTELDSIKLFPELFFGYAHEFLEKENILANFVDGSARFTTHVNDDREDSFYFGGGVSAQIQTNLSLYARYAGELYSGSEVHCLEAGLVYRY